MGIDYCYLSKNDCYKDEDFYCERLYLINTYIRSENNKIAFTDIKNQYIEENTWRYNTTYLNMIQLIAMNE